MSNLLTRPLPVRFFFLFPYFVMLISGLMVPSDGGHGFLSIKSLSFVGSVLGIMMYQLIRFYASWNQLKIIIFMIGSAGFLGMWSFISVIGEQTPAASLIDQVKIFWLTLSVIAITLFLFYEKLLTYQNFLKTLIYANLAYSSSKLIFVILHLIGVINMWDILDAIGLRYMRMGILGDLSRFQTSVDIITPFLLLFILQSDRLGLTFSRPFKIFYIVVSIFSIFLSFSRFLIFIGALSLCLHAMTLTGKAILKSFAIAIAILILAVMWIGVDNVYSMIEMRLYSHLNKDSDATRVNQTNALLEEFAYSPLFGKGLGSYAEKNIRDPVNLYSYEVQWVAFLMQFGIFGLFIILAALSAIAVPFLKGPFSRTRLAFLFLFGLWLFSGFTNPFLISLTSGIIYALFMLTGLELNRQREKKRLLATSSKVNLYT